MRYDPDKETASFLVLEEDWKALHSDTVFILISSSVSCTSNAVKLKRSCKTLKNNACCFANEDIDINGRNSRTKETFRPKRRKSRLTRNLSCVSVSCMSDASGRGLQKYDSCYRLEIITSQDLVIHNAGHVHSSRDCLISTEMNTVRFFQSGIDAPPFEQKGDVTVHENGHAMNDEDNNVTTTKERVDDLVQSYGLLEVTLVKPQTSKTDQLEVGPLRGATSSPGSSRLSIWRRCRTCRANTTKVHGGHRS